MNRLSKILATTSLCLGLIAFAVVIASTHVDPRSLAGSAFTLDRAAALRFSLWMALNVFFSSWKWRLTDEALRSPEEQRVSTGVAFAATAFGATLGQILPAPISMAASRTLASTIYGKALRRGTLATIFEQIFDVVALCLLAIPSVLTCVMRRGAGTWFAMALPLSLFAVWGTGKALDAVFRITTKFNGDSQWERTIANLQDAGLFHPKLARKLMVLAFGRFAVNVLTASQTTAAIHAVIPVWYLAVAMPLVLMAVVIGVTPGGIGLAESGYAGTLHFLGVPLAIATRWAIATRVLSLASTLVISIVAGALLALKRVAVTARTSNIRRAESAR